MTQAHVDEENLRRVGGKRVDGGVEMEGWVVETRHGVMMKDAQLEEMRHQLGDVLKTPEIVYGQNQLQIRHLRSGLKIVFNAFDALREWTEENLPPLQVKIAKEWQQERNHDIEKHQAKMLSYDWTFTSSYTGNFLFPDNVQSTQSQDGIDFELLKKKDPILFYDAIPLYESELDDNGYCQFEVLVRVMPQFWFAISRYFLRVDHHLIRLREARLLAKFSNSGEIVLDQKHWECSFEELLSRKMSSSEAESFQDVASTAAFVHSLYPDGTHLNRQQRYRTLNGLDI